MVTLQETLSSTNDWVIDRIHTLCASKLDEDAFAIQREFNEWLDPNTQYHDVYSLEYLGETDD
jgi:hypothetical protein